MADTSGEATTATTASSATTVATATGGPHGWLRGLEGPRGLACLCVVLVHVAVAYAPGVLAATRLDFLGQALTFFFVLSGFLLYLPHVKRLQSGAARPATGRYLVGRLRRVFPAYLVIFLVTNFVLQVAYVQNPVTVGWSQTAAGTGMITDPLDLAANLSLTQSLFPSTLQTGLNPSWSLTVEWGFYLVLPLIGMAVFALRGRGRLGWASIGLLPVGVLLGIGMVTNVVVAVLQKGHPEMSSLEQYWGPNWIAVLSRSFFALADSFAFGMLAAVIYVAIGTGAFAAVSTRCLQAVFGGLAAIGLVLALLAFVLEPRVLPTIFGFASAALILLIIAPIGRGEDSVIATVTDWRPLRYVGTISLSVYLWHFPVLLMLERAGLTLPDSPVGLLSAFTLVSAITIAVASVTYALVEKRAMRWRG